jgi:TfoX/Sxy family transcriptional regulator of competence genes
MPGFEKSPPELVDRFDAFVTRFDGVERRKMFGYPALFLGGNLVCGLYERSWMVRLPDDAMTDLLALPGATPFSPMAGRTMKGYAVLPPAVVADDAALEHWVRRAIDHVATMPAKS